MNFELTFREADATLKTVTINALPMAQILAQKPSLDARNRLAEEKYTFKLQDDIALLKVKSFQPEKALSYRKFLANAFKQLQDQKVQALLLDLRDNGGGYPEATWQLLRYLIDEPVQASLVEYAMVDQIPAPHDFEEEMFFKHFHRQKKVFVDSMFEIKGAQRILKPYKKAYRGPLYVLMNAASASATGEFLGQLKTHTEAVFMGEEAGSNPVSQSASDLLKLTLPNSKIRVVIPAIQSISRVDFPNDGHGIRPDVECIPSIESVLAGEDELLVKALQMVHAQK
ncbi:MAG: S41 family peptidase [Bacteroidota bacterium]